MSSRSSPHLCKENQSLLVDLIMPGFAEFEGLELLRSRYPGTPIVVFSIHEKGNLSAILKGQGRCTVIAERA